MESTSKLHSNTAKVHKKRIQSTWQLMPEVQNIENSSQNRYDTKTTHINPYNETLAAHLAYWNLLRKET